MWEAEEVSWLATVALTFPSVTSASVLGAAVLGAGGVALGSSGVAGGTGVGTGIPGVEALGTTVVALGEMLGAAVVAGSDGRVEAAAGELALRPPALVVLPSSGAAVGALLGLLEEVGAAVGGSESRGRRRKEHPEIPFRGAAGRRGWFALL